MEPDTLAAALEREHREIDGGIEAFIAGHAAGARGAEPLIGALDALRRHIYLEERFLFPPLRAAGMIAPILVMEREHGELWRTMDALVAELGGAGGEPAAVVVGSRLLDQLGRHNSKEEPVIYPQADAGLGAAAAAELRSFLDEGRIPDGWVCARAGA
jgi:iron-sulfur cluster repair protein YtfE (RIC family)